MKGMWDRIVLNASDRMSRAAEDTEKYQQGDRNVAEQALMGASQAVGGVMDVPGEVVMTSIEMRGPTCTNALNSA